MKLPLRLILACLSLTLSSISVAAPPSFNDDIRPILSENCFKCHGPDEGAREAGLRLDIEAGSRAELESGARAVVAGDVSASELVSRITAPDPLDRMPPVDSGKSLTPEQIDLLREWVERGGEYEKHWAFVAPKRPEVPSVSNQDRVRNPIDAFVLSRLEENDILPSPKAKKITLLRRVHLDLTGLPPSPKEVDAFLADEAPDAYEKAVDGLFASPHFGERWGRHWLDVARYADSNGYSIDSPRSIWPYRDWVVNALNDNMPFDQFVIEQMAGDLLPEATRERLVATGFHRNTMINEEGGIDPEEFRIDAVSDRVNTLGTAFLGLTLGCAKCHDHKYDPVSQEEYYQFFAFFNSDDDRTTRLPTPEQEKEGQRIDREIAAIRDELGKYIERPGAIPDWIAGLTPEQVAKFEPAEQEAVNTSPADRTDEQQSLVKELFKKHDKRYREGVREIERLRRFYRDIPTTLTLARLDEPRETHLLVQGDFTRKGDPVSPGVPAVLHAPENPGDTRLGLAQWLVDPENPLLARVTVNRFWQRLFGKGIVETENDFGSQGSLPTHPELLDWLAVEFVESRWDVKGVLKTIVMSSTYRQSSDARPDLSTMDPNNVLLARQNRIRLDAEIIRDSALVASNKLNTELGGPVVYPPQPEGVTKLGQRDRKWPESDGGDRYRRGLYTAFWRGTPYYALTVFDAPNAQEACTRRNRSNTPLQALTLLNDKSFVELAQGLAQRIVNDGSDELDERIREAFQWTVAREPSADEIHLVRELYEAQLRAYQGRDIDAAAAAFGSDEGDVREGAAWTMVARALLNLDEFVTRE